MNVVFFRFLSMEPSPGAMSRSIASSPHVKESLLPADSNQLRRQYKSNSKNQRPRSMLVLDQGIMDNVANEALLYDYYNHPDDLSRTKSMGALKHHLSKSAKSSPQKKSHSNSSTSSKSEAQIYRQKKDRAHGSKKRLYEGSPTKRKSMGVRRDSSDNSQFYPSTPEGKFEDYLLYLDSESE